MSNENKMLIDATHPEETRVVVLRDGRVEEFDHESAAKRPLRGNIYLARVTRVEPSLQAAFVEYGGNRHGFLAFNEIHPDYYQIPHADRQALLEAMAQNARDEDEEDERSARSSSGGSSSGGTSSGRPSSGRRNAKGGRRNDQRRRPRRGKPDDRSDAATAEDAVEPTAFSGHDDAAMPAGLEASEAHDHAPASDESAQHSSSGSVPDTGSRAAIAAAHDAGDAVLTGELSDILPADAPADAIDASGETHGTELSSRTGSAADDLDPADDDYDDDDFDDEVEEIETIGAHHHDDHEDDDDDDDDDRDEQGSAADRDLDDDDDIESAGAAKRTGAGDDMDDAPHPVGLVEDISVREIGQDDSDEVESVGSEDALEEVPVRRRRSLRSYKIQEVIKRRQILLIQVVKEERGNKGAALTTYLSLAGRFTVMMPNTNRGGGISRKITNAVDRKRLREIADGLNVPKGMGLIIRTAGAARTQAEIGRDYEYLMRLWENVRALTLKSTAPALVYEEGNLIKRSIRDLYSKEIDDILVAGEAAYDEAHGFMGMLMPTHAQHVKHYTDAEPLFARYKIERQLNAMFSPYVTLKSGGYIVINQTEALVSVDVNSGKSTKEHSIEDTALQTNLEAASEVARQLKLRDLAGLIVIDFIDMDERRNNRSVERRLKDSLKNDRARIQVGRISHFGLLEMSRQRLRTGVLEGSTTQCPHCQGTGVIRSTESVALAVLRSIEDELMGGARANLVAHASVEVALYMLNQKRDFLNEIERRYNISVTIQASDNYQGANFHIERTARPIEDAPRIVDAVVRADWDVESLDVATAPDTDEDSQKKSRRRRRRRGGRGDGERGEAEVNRPERNLLPAEAASDDDSDGNGNGEVEDQISTVPSNGARPVSDTEDAEGDTGRPAKRSRRRGKRGGRRNRIGRDEAEAPAGDSDDTEGNGAAVIPATLAAVPGTYTRHNGDGRHEVGGHDAEAPGRDNEAQRASAQIATSSNAGIESRAAVSEVADNAQFAMAAVLEQPVADTHKAEPAAQQVSEIVADDLAQSVAETAPEAQSEVAPPASPTVEPEPLSQKAGQKPGWWQRRIGGGR